MIINRPNSLFILVVIYRKQRQIIRSIIAKLQVLMLLKHTLGLVSYMVLKHIPATVIELLGLSICSL